MNPMPDPRERELLDRWMSGGLPPAEEAEARRLASELFGRPDALELLREVAMEEGMLGMVLDRIHAEQAPAVPAIRTREDLPRRAPRPPGLRREDAAVGWWGGVARAAAVLLVVGGASAFGVREWARHRMPEPQTVATLPGQRVTVALPDGSSAVLAPNTTLRYSISAERGIRNVELHGQAYFEILHDEDRPFRIRTRHAVVEDLGTSFVVREYAADSAARVAVRSGAVSVRARDAAESAATELRVGEAVDITASGAVTELAGDLEHYWSWTTGRLVFDGARLPEVLSQLAVWYDVEFRLTDSTLADQYFTGAFEAASLPQVLDILGPLVHARFEQQARVVIVSPRPGSR